MITYTPSMIAVQANSPSTATRSSRLLPISMCCSKLRFKTFIPPILYAGGKQSITRPVRLKRGRAIQLTSIKARNLDADLFGSLSYSILTNSSSDSKTTFSKIPISCPKGEKSSFPSSSSNRTAIKMRSVPYSLLSRQHSLRLPAISLQ